MPPWVAHPPQLVVVPRPRAAWRTAVDAWRDRIGRLFDARSADRRLLEDVILGHYARQTMPIAVLSIGVHRASRRYASLLDGHRYVTLDRDPTVVRYGSAQQHIVGSIDALAEQADEHGFDLVVLNGVLGWGLDDAEAADRALRQLHRVLRPGGELVVGWNDRPGRRPFGPVSPETLPALRLFHRSVFRPLQASTVCTGGLRRHRYDFFRKPCAEVPLDA